MSMFPTQVAMDLARKAGIHKLTTHEIDLQEAIKDFQKVSIVSDFKDAVIMLEAHLNRGELDDEQIAMLQRIYDFTDIEVDGIIIDKIGAIVKEARVEANSLSAAQLMNSIRNGESQDITKGTIKKVIFELQK